ncbi:MAG: tRNA/rRNA methyltransferase (SpoU) [uncultured bacterium]|nr:MAG: tRNA/rRNA methyltransferase (SpoU) [uncultured bacterium]
MQRQDSKYLRKNPPKTGELKQFKRNPINFVLDNVLDTYNIGSVFRLGDATAVEKIYICGEHSEYPPSSRIHKAAVGTEEWVPWEHHDSTIEVIKKLKKQGVFIIAIEQDKGSINYCLMPSALRLPVALVVGHETTGVSKEVLDMADLIVELPMFGINKSINVWGSLAIITYKVIENF